MPKGSVSFQVFTIFQRWNLVENQSGAAPLTSQDLPSALYSPRHQSEVKSSEVRFWRVKSAERAETKNLDAWPPEFILSRFITPGRLIVYYISHQHHSFSFFFTCTPFRQ
jgi:hypothetical protein